MTTISRMPILVRRGDVWWVDFGPGIGSEIKKRRPAIVISADYSNQALTRFQVVPATSNTSRLYPSEAYVTLAGKQSKAMADQITTVGQERLVRRMDRIAASELAEVENAVRRQLGL
jgi:mRNA interferase MazF